jgi:hypothetical protein
VSELADEPQDSEDQGHEGQDHEGHDHEGHDHEGHDHEGHDHEGHDHGDDAMANEAIAAMMDTIRSSKVVEIVVSSISTFATVAYAKLEAKDLPEAKAAIDVIDALTPFLTDDAADIRREFERALTELKVAYASAVPFGQ